MPGVERYNQRDDQASAHQGQNIWEKPWSKWGSEWATGRSSFYNAPITAYNTQSFSENFKVFMLRTIIPNDQLKHFKAACNQVLRERDPEQVSWGPARMPGEIKKADKEGPEWKQEYAIEKGHLPHRYLAQR